MVACLISLKLAAAEPRTRSMLGLARSDAGGPLHATILSGLWAKASPSVKSPTAGNWQRTIIGRIDAASVEAAIADSGAGIPGEQLHPVFVSFFTTRGDGPRMGPSIARPIVEAHGGRIRPEIRCRGGAVFRVAFPLAQPTVG